MTTDLANTGQIDECLQLVDELTASQSVDDAKSLLLMLKSIGLGSLKVQLSDYKLARESGDAELAADIITNSLNPDKKQVQTELANLVADMLRQKQQKSEASGDSIAFATFQLLSVHLQRECIEAFLASASSTPNGDKKKGSNHLFTNLLTIINLLTSSADPDHHRSSTTTSSSDVDLRPRRSTFDELIGWLLGEARRWLKEAEQGREVKLEPEDSREPRGEDDLGGHNVKSRKQSKCIESSERVAVKRRRSSISSPPIEKKKSKLCNQQDQPTKIKDEEGEVSDDEDEEEGEVLGEDDEECDISDEEEEEVVRAESPSSSLRTLQTPELTCDSDGSSRLPSILNVYRATLAFKLLPLLHQVAYTSNLSTKLITDVLHPSFKFIITYLAHIRPAKPSLASDSHCLANTLYHNPTNASLDACLLQARDLVGWPFNPFVDASSTGNECLKPTRDLLGLIKRCLDLLLTNRGHKKADARRKNRAAQAGCQAVMLYWTLFARLGMAYFERHRSWLLLTDANASTSRFPLNLSLLSDRFNEADDNNKKNDFLNFDDEFHWLSKLISLRYPRRQRTSSAALFDCPDVEPLDVSLRPATWTLFEQLICLDLCLAGLVATSGSVAKIVRQFFASHTLSSILPRHERVLLNTLFELVDSSSANDSSLLWMARRIFLRTYVQLANSSEWSESDQSYSIQSSSFTLLTKTYCQQLGILLVANWLASIAVNNNTVAAAPLALVLGQLQTSSELPIDRLLGIVKGTWTSARDSFVDCLCAIDDDHVVITDSSLIEQLSAIDYQAPSLQPIDDSHPVLLDKTGFFRGLTRSLTACPTLPLHQRLSQLIARQVETIDELFKAVSST